MDENVIEVTIDGRTYYLEAGRVKDLDYIGGKLVNVSNSQITLVTSFDTSTTYPRITCPAMQACRYQSSYNSNYSTVSSNFSVNKHSIYELGDLGLMSACLFSLLLLLGVRLIWKR